MQLPLHTRRLYLRELKTNDTDSLFEVLSDPQTMHYIEPPYSLEKTRSFVQHAGITNKLVFALILKNTSKLIGHVIYHPYEENGCEIGWIIHRDYWHMGFASEITEVLIQTASADGYHYLIIECAPEQQTSRHIADKYKFTYHGIVDGCAVYRLNLV